MVERFQRNVYWECDFKSRPKLKEKEKFFSEQPVRDEQSREGKKETTPPKEREKENPSVLLQACQRLYALTAVSYQTKPLTGFSTSVRVKIIKQ